MEEFNDIVYFIDADLAHYEVLDKLKIFAEPSIQGNMGSMVLYDDSDEDRFDSVFINWETWNFDIIDMISNSKSKQDFQNTFTKYLKDKIDQNSL